MNRYSEKPSKSTFHEFTVQNGKCIEANNSTNTQLLFLLRKHTKYTARLPFFNLQNIYKWNLDTGLIFPSGNLEF